MRKRLRLSLALVAAALAAPTVAPAQLDAAQPDAAARLALAPCTLPGYDGNARCGALDVRENRGRRDGRTIPIRVAVLPATGPSKQPDPIVVLQGGPGQAATDLAGFYGGPSWAASRTDRDILLVDQRGTGASNGLRCDLGGTDAVPQSSLGDLFPVEAVRRCRADLETRADLRHYTTLVAVEDLDAVRVALGIDKINLYGTSYGTRVAIAYAQRHPSYTRSMVLKGVVAPGMIVPAPFAEDTERAVNLLVRDCAADAACHGAVPSLLDTMRAAFAAAGRAPVSVALPATQTTPAATVSLTRGVLGALLRTWLQATPTAARLPALFARAAGGDWAPLAQLAVDTRRAQAAGLYAGMMLSVICTEDAPLLARAPASRTTDTFLGTYWVDQVTRACAEWPQGWTTSELRDPVESPIPALIISGDLDPATPPRWADELRGFLTRSAHVVMPGGSHSFAGLTGCVDTIIAAFFRAASPRGLDVTCAAAIRRPPFELPDTGK